MSEQEHPLPRIPAGIAFALMGAFALASQTVLFREHLVAYEGNELGAGAFFASWLAWVGIGAILSLVAIRRWARFRRGFVTLLALYPVAFAVQLLLIKFLRVLAGIDATDLFPLDELFLWTFLANAPVSLMTGILFTLASRGCESPSRVYVLESLGAFAGGAGVTAFLVSGQTALAPVALISAALGAIGWMLALRPVRSAAMVMHWFVLVLSGFLFLAGTGVTDWLLSDARIKALHPEAYPIASTETPYRRLDVAEIGRQTVVMSNGRMTAAWPDGGAALADAALLLTQPAETRRVLLLGNALTPLLREVLRYPVERVVLVEPDRRGHEFLLRNLHRSAIAPLDDPRVQLRFGDPVQLLAEEMEPFDLVVADAGDPDTAFAARRFTVEFYRRVRAGLAQDGVFATAITSAENYAGPEVARYGASVLATLSEVFPKVFITPGERSWFLAGAESAPITLDAGVLEKRLAGLAVSDRRFEPERLHQFLEPSRVEFARQTYAIEDRRGLVSTADRPQVYLLNLLVMGKREGTGLTRLVLAIQEAGIAVLLLPFLVILLVRSKYLATRPDAGRSGRFCGAYLLVVVGAASLALDLVLLLGFQQRFGLLFEKVGLANGLFMLGLFGGGVAGSRIARRWPDHTARSAALAGGAAALFALLLPSLMLLANSEWRFLGLFGAAGLLTGAPFPIAAAMLRRSGSDAAGAGGILECADHFGGALGAAVAGVLLVPLFGGAATARLLGGLLLTAPALIVLEAVLLRRLAVRGAKAGPGSFPRVWPGFVLAAAVLAAAAVSWPVRRELARPIVELRDERLAVLFPEAKGILKTGEPFHHARATGDLQDPLIGVAVATLAIPVEVSGYGGPINLLLALDSDLVIREVSLLEENETPAYIRELPEFLSRFAGKTAERDFRLVGRGESESDHDLVNITGATVSCRASLETVNEAKNRMLPELFGREPPSGAGGAAGTGLGAAEVATLLLFLLAVPVFLRGSSLVRTGFLVVVLGVLGVLYNQQVSAGRVAELFTLSLPPVGNLPHFLLIAGALLLSIAFGQVYCGLLCPFGAAQELLGKLGLRQKVSPGVDARARYVKHVVLGLTVTLFLLLGADAVFEFDPLSVVFSWIAGPVMWVLIGLILFLSLFYFRFWCRYICPVGAFFSLFNRVALLHRFARPKEYARCDLGVRTRRDLDCIQCNRCLTGRSG